MPRHGFGRRPACDMIRTLRLQVGDVIHSAAWKLPRVIRQIDTAGLTFAEVRDDGSMVSETHVASLPADLKKIDHPVRKSRPPV